MAKTKSVNYLMSIFVVVVVAGLVILILEVFNVTHFFHKNAIVRAPSQPITHIQTPITINPDKVPTTNTKAEQGSGTDLNGKVINAVPSNPSNWSSSVSGVITLKLPTINATIASGDVITGSATVNQVQYRLTDNQIGVISQGPINVINGVFTATINFITKDKNGRLDVFSTEPNGKEINEVQIPVKF